MDSYGVQRDSAKQEYTTRSESNGTYGLSIRVKGIGGHPYVVMNNQNRSPDSNGNIGKDSFLNDYNEYNARGGMVSANGAIESGDRRRSSSLRNIQSDQEPVNPYPLDNGYRSLPPNCTSPVQPTGPPWASSTSLQRRARSLTRLSSLEPPVAGEEAQPDPKGQGHALIPPLVHHQNQPPSQKQSQSQSQPKASTFGHAPRNSTMFTGRSTSTVDGAASSEQGGRKADVMPPWKQDSSDHGLLPSRSRHASTPSTTDKHLLDEEALYAENINRHENRRYIPFFAGTGRDIDSASIPRVDELISKFDSSGTHQHRGRAGRRNRIDPEDRKRSHSLDSLLHVDQMEDSEYLYRFSKSQGRSTEHLVFPSQLDLQKETNQWEEKVLGRYGGSPESPKGTVSNGMSSVLTSKEEPRRSSTLQLKSKTYEEEKPSRSVKVLTSTTPRSLSDKSGKNDTQLATARDPLVTPDLLRDQRDISQQTNEETARQILFSYLKDGSGDNDDATKKKVNLVFEKIQALRSRAAANVQGDKPPSAAAESRALQDLRAQMEARVTDLTKQLEEESKKQRRLAEACEKATEDKHELVRKLSTSQEESRKLREKLSRAETEFRATLEDLFQVKMEREQCQSEIRDLQDQLSEMHDELDGTKKSSTSNEEKEVIMETIMHLRLELEDALLAKEGKEEVLHKRERELTALKGALKEEVASHDQEVDKMKERYEQEIQKLRLSLEEAKQGSTTACLEKVDLEAAVGTAEGRVSQLSQEAKRLHQRTLELENQVAKLNRIIDEAKLKESRLEDRTVRLEKEKQQLEVSLEEAREQEEETSDANRALAIRLEDLQRNMTKLTQDYDDLSEQLTDESNQKELLKKTKAQMEDERKLLDRTVEKLQKAMSGIAEASQASTLELQVQINEYREKSRQEVNVLQRQLRDKDLEQEKSRMAMKMLQEELSQLEEDLRECKRERDEAVLTGQDLKRKLYDLEVELEANSHSKDDRSRQIKLMEDRISRLEQDLDEERLSGDELMNRISKGREQVEHTRNELLQERAARQDLECDKVALERRNKDLMSRLAHLEGSQKSSKEGLVSQLEKRIQELEERLEVEERDRANLLQANRKLERKVKDMTMQQDEERQSMQGQKDQLNLKLKALKRQMDEAEEAMERQENGRRKLQRDLEEQLEANEQLQGQLKGLRTEMRRKTSAAPLLNLSDDDDEDDDDFSTNGGFL